MKFWESVKILKTGQNFRQFWCASYSPKFPGHHKWCKCVKCAASPAKNWSQKSVSHLRKSCALQMAVDTRCFTQGRLFAWFHIACVRYTPEYSMHPVIVTPFDHFLGGLGGGMGKGGLAEDQTFSLFRQPSLKTTLKLQKILNRWASLCRSRSQTERTNLIKMGELLFSICSMKTVLNLQIIKTGGKKSTDFM